MRWIALGLGIAAGALLVARAVSVNARTPQAPAGEAHSAAADPSRPSVPPPSEKAVRYYRSGNALWAMRLAIGVAIPAVLLWSGFSARLRRMAERRTRRFYGVFVIYFVLLSLLLFVVGLPLDFYEGFMREHAYGLSNQTFTKWFGDALKGLMVTLVMGCLFLWVPLLVIRKSPRRWWLYTGLLSIPFFAFVLFVSPIWIAPLFNKFRPMSDTGLEARILALAERAGVEGARVFEVAKSVDTSKVNAYVTGFGQTKRIVLWDTLLAKLQPPETLFVLGHEMGHYVLRHVVTSVLLNSGLVLLALYGTYRTAGVILRRHGKRLGFTELHDVAALPLIAMLVGGFGFVLAPAALAISRHHEREADRFGLELTRDNRAAAEAFIKLQKENLAYPRPGWLVKVLRASHPPIGERVDFINSYRPWETGEPLRYERYFSR